MNKNARSGPGTGRGVTVHGNGTAFQGNGAVVNGIGAGSPDRPEDRHV
jgi:hypothetical protein